MAVEDESIYLNICRILKTLEGHRMPEFTVTYRDTGVRDTTLSAKRDHAICLVYQVLPGVSTQDLRRALVLQNLRFQSMMKDRKIAFKQVEMN